MYCNKRQFALNIRHVRIFIFGRTGPHFLDVFTSKRPLLRSLRWWYLW